MKTANFKLVVCFFPECKKPEYLRGLCMTHYSSASQMVCRKKTTWETLEKAGKVKPPKGPRHRYGSAQKFFLGE